MPQRKERRRRLNLDEEHGGHSEPWLISYADMITVLFILMCVLYAMSSIDAGKYQQLAKTLNGAFNPNGQSISQGLVDDGDVKEKDKEVQEQIKKIQESNQFLSEAEAREKAELDKLEKQLKEYIKDNNLEDLVNVKNTTKGVQITFQDVALFQPGSASISDKAKRTVAGIVPFLQTNDRTISIEGHTDNVPIHNAEFRDNFELSSERALSVLYFLQDSKVNPKRLSSAGFGEYHPVDTNDTVEGKAKNRRVNLIIMKNEIK